MASPPETSTCLVRSDRHHHPGNFATLLIFAGPPGLKTFYDLIVGLSTMAAVIPYAFCALATGLVAANIAGGGPVPPLGAIEVIAFVFAVFTLYGCGAKAVLYGTIMLVPGIPAYAWQRRRAGPTISKPRQKP